MNLQKIKRLTLAIKELEEELKVEKNKVLEDFRNMSEEDFALCDRKMEYGDLTITYYPKSTITSVDTAKLKKDGLFDKYSKTSTRTDYIKINIKEDK